MRRLTALLGKELRQHSVSGIILLACLVGGYLLMLVATLMNAESVSAMQAHASFLGLFVLIAAIVLGHRLVVAEYHGRTQLFLEALPIRRWEVVALKYGVGLAFLLLISGLSLAITTLVAMTREPLDGWFLTIVATRTAVYVFFLWAFLFGMGLIGRFRVPIYLLLLVMLGIVDEMTQLEIQRFGPIALLDNNTLPFERETMPVRALFETLGLGLAWTGIGFGLALIHEGSVAETLAKRMSQKEKALVGILFTAMMLAFVVFETRRDKAPYTFPEQETLVSSTVPLEILYLQPSRLEDAQTLSRRLETDLETLRQALGWAELPDVRIAYRPSLDADIYDRADLLENEGILVRANFRCQLPQHQVSQDSEDKWDPQAFSAYIVGLVLDEATDGRARFEPKAWLRDGFAQWWAAREYQVTPVENPAMVCADNDSPTRRAMLRALWATQAQPLDNNQLATWLRTRERHGEAVAEAMALSGLWVLEQSHGEAAVLALARAVFGRNPNEDIRELIYEWRHPMPAVFTDATPTDWQSFVAEWSAALDRWRQEPACRALLDTLPKGEAEVAIEHGEGTVRNIVYRFDYDRPWPAGTLVSLLHSRLPTPFDSPIERIDLRRREHLWPPDESTTSWRLPGFYGQGSRAFLALEIDSAILGCPIRLVAVRQEIR